MVSKAQKDTNPDNVTEPRADENIGVMVYGNLRIIDVDTGEILVNKRA
jgi:hypothetical protein